MEMYTLSFTSCLASFFLSSSHRNLNTCCPSHVLHNSCKPDYASQTKFPGIYIPLTFHIYYDVFTPLSFNSMISKLHVLMRLLLCPEIDLILIRVRINTCLHGSVCSEYDLNQVNIGILVCM